MNYINLKKQDQCGEAFNQCGEAFKMKAMKLIKEVSTTNIYDFIAECLGIEKNLLNADTSYQSISEWDSFRHVNLMLKLEKEYGVRINERDILKLTSVNAIEKFINSFTLPNRATESSEQELEARNIHRGLNGIYFDNTTITSIDGEKGKLLYRGYEIEEIAQLSNYEEICYLLIFGSLPTATELEIFKKSLIKKRNISYATLEFISRFNQLSFIDLLKSFLSTFSLLETQGHSSLEIGLDLISKLPLVVGYQKCLRENLAIPSIDPTASFAKSFLSLIIGREPSEESVRMLEQVMIIHADHGSNASSFVARVAASTGTNFYSAIVAAISTFSGELHGGALEKVIKMLDEIGCRDNVSAYIKKKIDNGRPIYGYGHRIYRTEDPRAKLMRELAKKISIAHNDTQYFNILEAINDEMKAHTKYGVNVNVDFYAAVIYHFLGIPHDMFIAVFIISRVVGWTAQIMEQEANNILIRPRLNYIGRKEEKYRPIHERSND